MSWNDGFKQTCPRCKATLHPSYTETFCPNRCAPITPGIPCLKCGSTNTEMFDVGSWVHLPEGTRHCLDCGSLLPPTVTP